MADRTLESTKLYIEVKTGTNSNGLNVYSKQPIFSLVEGANADKVVELCSMIEPLLSREAGRNIKTEVSKVSDFR